MHIRASASASCSRTRLASARRGACAIAGTRGGKRPPGRADQRYTFAYIFAAAEPGTDNAFALVMPEVSTQAMQIYLDKLSATIGVDEHLLLVRDRAGWHGANDL
ncbi:MAG TPA: hypothetical protein VFR73_17810, partial [Hyphomicrobiaceae bacterium]|nr:hypothetical protein [Hyphomicrobiaceae bacterium]